MEYSFSMTEYIYSVIEKPHFMTESVHSVMKTLQFSAGFALCTKLLLVFAKRKLAGVAEFAYFVAKAQSQTRFCTAKTALFAKQALILD